MIAKIFISLVRISPLFQKTLWKWWYQRLGKRAHESGWTFMNYGYAPNDKNLIRELEPEDENNRMFIQLYDHVASQIPIKGLKILEVGSGRGGGASFVARYHKPLSIIGLDYSQSATKLSNKLHKEIPNLDFVNGDAENLPFDNDTFDAVINVESSHCYGNMTSFVNEVYRVLKTGGKFGWTDFRGKDMIKETEGIFEQSKFNCIQKKTITPQVLNALDSIHVQKIDMIKNHVPQFLQKAFKDFAGVKDSQIYNAFKNGNAEYLFKTLKK